MVGVGYTMTSVGLGRGFRTAPADAARCLTCASRAVDGRGTRGGAVVFWPIVLEPIGQDLANGPGGSDATALAVIWSWMRESDDPSAEPSSTYAGPGCDGSNGHIAASRLDELAIGSWLAMLLCARIQPSLHNHDALGTSRRLRSLFAPRGEPGRFFARRPFQSVRNASLTSRMQV